MTEERRVLPPFAKEHSSFPPREFSAIPLSLKRKDKSRSYGRHSACERVLTGSLEAFRVSKYQLSKLLGVRDPSNLRRWFSGRTRPGSLYLTRLLQLWMMSNSGIPLFRIRAIDWDQSMFYWKDGTVTVEQHHLEAKRSFGANGGAVSRESDTLPPHWGSQKR